jgi:mannose/fructose/N-acetylgalactosamine-specific phosphotransferase system component IID
LNDKFSDELAMEENEENQDDIDDSWDFKRR